MTEELEAQGWQPGQEHMTLAAYQKLSESLEAEVPSLYMIPNVAQYRALEAMYPPPIWDGFKEVPQRMPDWTSVEFANGVGKSALMILDMVGWTMGPEYLCAEAYPPSAIAFYRSLQPLRDSGKLSMRLCCVSEDMKEGGSVKELLKEIFPWAKAVAPDTSKCFRQIDIPHPSLPYITLHISVKTFDQDQQKHSGSTCKRIWINEQLYDNLFGETMGRIRSKAGGVEGTIAEFATRLDRSSLHDNLEKAGHFTLKRVPGHLFENCVGEAVTDEMAYEVLMEIGVQMQKNPNGPGYITNGVASLPKLLAMIDFWTRSCPHQLAARKSGRPISTGGKIWPTYDRNVHVVPNETYDVAKLQYPVVQVVDPHPARPDACIWAVILPSDRIHIIDEWPPVSEFGYFDQIQETRFTIGMKTDIWRRHEANCGYSDLIGDNRVGDPNRFKEPNPESHSDLAGLYSDRGFDFDLNISDDFEYGVELVAEYLWFDQNIRRMHPEDPSAQPRLTFARRCENAQRAMENFARKVADDPSKPVSEQVDKKYECFAACVRYLIVWHRDHHFEDLKNARKDRGCDDYEKIRLGRIPKSMR